MTVVVFQKLRLKQKVCVLETERRKAGTELQKNTGSVIGFMTGATIGSVIIVIAISQS